MTPKTRKLFFKLTALSALMMLLVAACGSDDAEDDATTTTATTEAIGEETTTSTTEDGGGTEDSTTTSSVDDPDGDTTTSTDTTPEETTTTSTLPPLSEEQKEGLDSAYIDYYENYPVACDGIRPEPVQPVTFTEPVPDVIPAGNTAVLEFVTSCGVFTMRLDNNYPETANNLAFLARQGYFNGSLFHRLVSGFVIQGGDPTGTGTGDPGYSIVDEYPPDGHQYLAGDVAMANSGPGSTGSQFFIVLNDNTGLPNTYNPVGDLRKLDSATVQESQNTVNEIIAIPTEDNGSGEASRPLEALYIEQVFVSFEPVE